ncbi:MAG: glycosyltransferase family 4 protein [Azoarcus sp.]|jgi:Fuc2NAc and GlcNAc transferase|nr:glycosyltransferase family 4 protein [Azoarcus sp.]
MEIAQCGAFVQWWWLVAAAAAASLALTALLRHYALRRHLLDVPNARSSHTRPTPRGGGLAIVASFAAALVVAGYAGLLPTPLILASIFAGGIVAVTGFADDHGHIAARWRLLAHFAAAGTALLILPEIPALFAGPMSGSLLALTALTEAFYLAWMLNLYNFMDGIDGIAATEAVCVCLGGAALFLLGDAPCLAIAPILLAAAVAGFLCWNWPPARIFMGDGGSGFLGFTLGLLSLQAPAFFWHWTILLAVFICDASLTLARRALAGQTLHEAHRSHAYQHAAQRWGHLPVTLTTAAINLFWLLPLALAAALDWLPLPVSMVAAYAPLLALAWHLNAGKN